MLADLTIASAVPLIIAVVGVVWKIRKERTETQAQIAQAKTDAEHTARSVAVEESENAVRSLGAALERAEKTIERTERTVSDQGERITLQDRRISDMGHRHGVAIDHIADREDAAAEYLGPGRPDWLPVVPELIRPDVDASRRQH
ncbi:MAG: hypothetical protein LKG15_07900 [Corynebacterium provencense]|jgi:septal ring factor EnvC (AmiA/AmiB activator)|uniref:hypothetical protein n=1 Tax=Corynebacterium provencense TaxID=1737425 RepID=UPI002989B867|nr:hypothetical protein [Corynebacterium provencense]